jgi:hypothetical protein
MLLKLRNTIFFKVFNAVLEMSGILLDKFTWPRILLLFLIGIEIISFNTIEYLSSYHFVIYYATIWFVVRQSFLFLSFTKNGIASRMKKVWGEENAGEIYLIITAFSFWYRARSYGLLLKHTSWDFFPVFKSMFPTLFILFDVEVNLLTIIGYILIIFGTIINIWSFILIKREAYYYMDMFYGKFFTDFQVKGPYKWFNNPMYGPGQLPSYGLALSVGSFTGILFSIANQIFAYLFYFLKEKPHIKRCVDKLNFNYHLA